MWNDFHSVESFFYTKRTTILDREVGRGALERSELGEVMLPCRMANRQQGPKYI